jgi:hypothetical protein
MVEREQGCARRTEAMNFLIRDYYRLREEEEQRKTTSNHKIDGTKMAPLF